MKMGVTMKHLIRKSMDCSLSMIITFLFHYALDATRANGFLFQNVIVDPARDSFMFAHCLLHYSFGRYR
jgi:hypothetical protein